MAVICPDCNAYLDKTPAGLECPSCGFHAPCERGVYRFSPAPADHPSFPRHIFAALVEMEKHHFWMAARRELVADWLSRMVAPTESTRVLDVGCGSGHVMTHLQKHGFAVAGADVFHEPLEAAAQATGAELYQVEAAKLPFRREFNAAIVLDVLEHVRDEEAVVNSVRETLVPGGVLVATVPAMPSLWTKYDRAAGHLRRYTPQRLAEVVTAAGMTVERMTHFMSFLAPVAFAIRAGRELVDRITGRSFDAAEVLAREIRPRAPLDRLWLQIARLERRILRRTNLPVGTSLVIAARRRD